MRENEDFMGIVPVASRGKLRSYEKLSCEELIMIQREDIRRARVEYAWRGGHAGALIDRVGRIRRQLRAYLINTIRGNAKRRRYVRYPSRVEPSVPISVERETAMTNGNYKCVGADLVIYE